MPCKDAVVVNTLKSTTWQSGEIRHRWCVGTFQNSSHAAIRHLCKQVVAQESAGRSGPHLRESATNTTASINTLASAQSMHAPLCQHDTCCNTVLTADQQCRSIRLFAPLSSRAGKLRLPRCGPACSRWWTWQCRSPVPMVRWACRCQWRR